MTAPAEDDSPDIIDAFLSRAERLTPTQWGRLEARGARLTAKTPLALIERARIDGATFGLWNFLPEDVATGAALAARGAFWSAVGLFMAAVLLADPGFKRMKHMMEPERRKAFAEAQARRTRRRAPGDEIERIGDACRAHTGDTFYFNSGAFKALMLGYMALQNRMMLSDKAFATVYATVEPIIPFSSLTEHPLLSAGTDAG